EPSRNLMVCRPMLRECLREGRKLGPKLVTLVLRRRRGHEGARFEGRAGKGAMKPDAELPCDLEDGERSTMVAGDGVTRGVTRASDFTEELYDLSREDPLILQSTKEVILRLVARGVETYLGGHELCEQLRELPQLQDRGVRIVGEVPFGKHP